MPLELFLVSRSRGTSLISAETISILMNNDSGVQFNRHLKFKAWVKALVKDEVKDAFRKALDRERVKAWVKAVQNVY